MTLLSHLGVGDMGVEPQHSQTHQTDVTATVTSLAGRVEAEGAPDPLGLCFSIRKAELTKGYIFFFFRFGKSRT